MEVDAEIENLLSKRFDIKFWEKTGKSDNGYLNFSYYEIIIQSKSQEGKIKTNKSIAYPEISSIFIQDHEHILLDLGEKNCQINIQMENPLYLLKCVYVAFKIFFPLEDIFTFFAVKAESSVGVDLVKEEVRKMRVIVQSPCNNFTFGIKFYAKYSYLTENEEIIWDIDTVYGNKDTRQFFLKDFDHLKQKYLFPVIGAMCYNSYFNELTLSNVDLTAYDKLLERVFRFNKGFRKLYFANCNLKSTLCAAIGHGMNGQKSLVSLDLSCNEGIGDKGLELFIPFLRKYSKNLEVFKMSKCNLSTISICKIADSFTYNIRGDNAKILLRVLDLSNNPLKEGFKEIFYDFLSNLNHLEDLNLAGMNSSIEQLPICLSKGSFKTLKYLNLSDNISPASSQACTQWSMFFRSVVSLIQVNLSNFKSLHCSVTDGLLLGLGDNTALSVTSVELNISNSSFNGDNFKRFVSFIFNTKCVTYLDFSNNGIDLEGTKILKHLPEFTSLKSLNMSNNFLNVKSKDQQSIIMSLTLALQTEDANLQELYIANCNFGSNLSTFISELDCLFSLQILDISGNNIGNIVARTLGRMLTIDRHLKEIIMDNNNVSREIYEEILDGLETNFTLMTFHIPFVDLVKYPPKLVLPVIDKINKHHIKVNKIFQGVSFEDIKAMAFNCIMSQTSENIDKCRTTLQESCNRLKSVYTTDNELEENIKKTLERSFDTIKTVEKSREILAKLNAIYKDNFNNPSLSSDIRIKKIIETICNQVSELVNDYLHEVVDELIKEINQTLPLLSKGKSNLNSDLLDICKKSMVVSSEYIRKLFERFIEQNLTKKVYETELNVTNSLCDRVTDEIISLMNICDMNTNKLLILSRNINEAPRSPSFNLDDSLLRNVESRKSIRAVGTRNSRMSTMAAVKARPISKAIKHTMKEVDFEEDLTEILNNVVPIVPERTKRLNAKKESSSSAPDCSNENNVLASLKDRPRKIKKFKSKVVSPNITTLRHSLSISDEIWNNFHSPEIMDKPSDITPKKKNVFFNMPKSKKPKPQNVDFSNLGKELSDSEAEKEEKPKVGSEQKHKKQPEDLSKVSKKNIKK